MSVKRPVTYEEVVPVVPQEVNPWCSIAVEAEGREGCAFGFGCMDGGLAFSLLNLVAWFRSARRFGR